jgi:GNAT superfamily N-acetyltransferase
MPRVHGDTFVNAENVDYLLVHNEPLLEYRSHLPDEIADRIGRYVARIVEDGDTIQVGPGSLPNAVCRNLRDKRHLGVHTDLFTDGIATLMQGGVVDNARKSIHRGKTVASFCMGTRETYEYIHDNPAVEFHPVDYTNNPRVVARNENMTTISSAFELDLTGQATASSLGKLFYHGIGGQADFLRGAVLARNGKTIVALPSTAENETVSRIVPCLAQGAGVTLIRGDVHYVVTEYGIAYLHGKSIKERAMALIHIAHPKFRRELMQAAKVQKYLYEDQIELAWEKVDYPAELERYEALEDGTEIFFRPVKPTDEPALKEMLYSLSAESVRLRFFTTTKTFPHRDVQQLTTVDYVQDLAIVGIVPGPGGEEDIVAIAQYFLDPKSNAAEVAFIVQDEWQAKGMGSFLLRYLAEIAHKRGVKKFEASVVPRNKPMLAVFHNSGYRTETVFDGDAYKVEIDLTDEAE